MPPALPQPLAISSSPAAPVPTAPTRRGCPPLHHGRPRFVCSFCHHPHAPPANAVGQSARQACDGCYRALVDLAVCWRCGELVYRGDACVSLGWCFWHRMCFGCLFCGAKTRAAAECGPRHGGEGDGEQETHDEWLRPGTGQGAAVELDEIP